MGIALFFKIFKKPIKPIALILVLVIYQQTNTMKNIIKSFASLVMILMLSSFTSSPTESTVANWEKLGSRIVDFKLDRDVIHVGKKDRRFSKLKLFVTGGNLNMHKMKVEYLNGQVENIKLKHNFSRQSSSRVIDIDGYKRVIKNIIFWYDTKNISKKKAKVTVLGK